MTYHSHTTPSIRYKTPDRDDQRQRPTAEDIIYYGKQGRGMRPNVRPISAPRSVTLISKTGREIEGFGERVRVMIDE